MLKNMVLGTAHFPYPFPFKNDSNGKVCLEISKILGVLVTSMVFEGSMHTTIAITVTRKPRIFEISRQIQLQIDLSPKLRRGQG